MVSIRKNMLKAAGYKAQRINATTIHICNKQEEVVVELLEKEDLKVAVKYDGKVQFECEHVIANISNGKLFLIARNGVKSKRPYLEYYLWL